MKQILLITLFLGIIITSFSQDKIYNYKSAADKEISRLFDSSLQTIIRCDDVSFIDIHNTETWSPNYENVKSEKVKPQTITLTYSFFSKPISDTFSFMIKVTRQKNGSSSFKGFDYIPMCILQNTVCKFITRDSAIKIAINDSIMFPDNLTIEFSTFFDRKNYYWKVIGRPKKVNSTVHRANTIPSRSRKFINALTGQLISWQDYQKPD